MAKTIRELDGAPGTLGLYAKAALPLVPGASRLPFVAGRGRALPKLELRLHGVRADPDELVAYDRVCGFPLRDALPATYLHVRAFPLHMALMTDGAFPFAPVGLVHLRNRITQYRPVDRAEAFDLRVHTMPVQPHPKGTTFTLVSEARVGDELVWQDASTMLRRGSATNGVATADRAGDAEDGRVRAARRVPARPQATGPARQHAQDHGIRAADLPAVAHWRLPEDLGRRYAAASGDRNPIHLHALSAKLLGFPRAIAHGMWTKARCLAALDARLPAAYTVDVTFRRPILLPGTVAFAAEDGVFAVRSARDDTKIHLEGTVTAR